VPDLVGGLTLGADPVAYAVAVAARTRGGALDAFSVRKQAKTHGSGKRIEGCFTPGAAVVVVEDVITTGHSAAEAIAAVIAEADGSWACWLSWTGRKAAGRCSSRRATGGSARHRHGAGVAVTGDCRPDRLKCMISAG